jgi:hypothetical protein
MKIIPGLLLPLLNKAKSLFMEEMNPEMTVDQSATENPPPETPTVDDPTEEVPSEKKKITWLSSLSAVFNGLGIGLLLGILLGLSISPVVSGVIGTLTGILALLLGLNEKYLDSLKSMRIGAFGVFAVVGIIIGLYIRANDPFAPSLKTKMDNFLEIGYSEEEARAFITKDVISDSTRSKREAGVLYSSTVDAGACDVLQYASADQPVNELVNTFKEAGGTWKELAEEFSRTLPDNMIGNALVSMRDIFCGMASEGEIKMTKNAEVEKLGKSDSLEKIEKVFSSAGSGWKAIRDNLSSSIPENQRKEVYLTVIKVMTHD